MSTSVKLDSHGFWVWSQYPLIPLSSLLDSTSQTKISLTSQSPFHFHSQPIQIKENCIQNKLQITICSLFFPTQCTCNLSPCGPHLLLTFLLLLCFPYQQKLQQNPNKKRTTKHASTDLLHKCASQRNLLLPSTSSSTSIALQIMARQTSSRTRHEAFMIRASALSRKLGPAVHLPPATFLLPRIKTMGYQSYSWRKNLSGFTSLQPDLIISDPEPTSLRSWFSDLQSQQHSRQHHSSLEEHQINKFKSTRINIMIFWERWLLSR